MAVLLAKAAAAVAAAMVRLADLVPVDGQAAVLEVPAAVAAAVGSSSAARRFANSASRRSTASTTRTSGYCQDLSLRPERSCLAV
jgi:hypothetical protein